jgi:hypothetical protein
MNQTRLLVWLGCLLALTPAGFSGVALAAELLQREGRFIRLTTDLESAEEADTLVTSFDAAAGQWNQFWNLPDDALATWKVDAYVIRDKAEFKRQGLIPPRVPDFPFGYALGNKIWVLAQQSEYYTRHLLLHEGVHCLAFYAFGGAGPTWYREGTAELLSTHRGKGAGLKINQIPATRDEVPYWGRFKRLTQLREQSAVPTLATVMRYKPDLRGDVGVYGWSWAAAMMLHAYPESRDAFVDAAGIGRDDGGGFNRRLQQGLSKQWPALAARWRLHCHDLDYGFDWSRERVALAANDPVWDGRTIRTEVAAGQGWQSIGVRVPRGQRIQLTASGQITLAPTPKPWISEPAGITFQYHRGRPLGQLLVCVLPNAIDPHWRVLPPLDVRPLEQPTTLEIPQYSWLLMRVNDGVSELSDNTGHYDVTITRGG